MSPKGTILFFRNKNNLYYEKILFFRKDMIFMKEKTIMNVATIGLLIGYTIIVISTVVQDRKRTISYIENLNKISDSYNKFLFSNHKES